MKIFKKLEDTFAAAAFAEAGEFETAREMLKDNDEDKGKSTRADNTTTTGGQGNMTELPSKA